MKPGELRHYAPQIGTGIRAVRVDWPTSDVHVNVDGLDQPEIDRIAGLVADAAQVIESNRKRLEELSAALATCRARLRDREDSIDALLGLMNPRTFGEIAARERDGIVWLGRASDDWQSHFAFCFEDWSSLRRTYPELAPCGVRVDADGQAAVLMRAVPIREEGSKT